MNKKREYSFELKLLFHVAMGLLSSTQPFIVVLWVLYIIAVEGTIKVYKSSHPGLQATLTSSYLASLEMIVRMSKSGLPHEVTKYAIIFVLLNGILSESKLNKRGWEFAIFFLLLTPSILMIDLSTIEEARQAVSFNLAGPLCLAVSGFYFKNRTFSQFQLMRIFQMFLLPVSSTVTWLFIRTPSISEIDFKFGANFAASGYGPNQMASVLGFGILIIGLSLLFRIRVFKNQIAALFFMAIIAYRSLLTFSRGGMLAPVIVLFLLVIYFYLSDRGFRKQMVRLVLFGVVFVLSFYIIYSYTNDLTGGALFDRYAGISNGEQVSLQKYSSGRLAIMKIDLAIFFDNPIFGIGPGMGNGLRADYGYNGRVAAHVEFTRLLAEHGVFGILSIIFLLLSPLKEFLVRKSIQQRFLLAAGALFCLAFMSHSATRIALPMFAYGLGFVRLNLDN